MRTSLASDVPVLRAGAGASLRRRPSPMSLPSSPTRASPSAPARVRCLAAVVALVLGVGPAAPAASWAQAPVLNEFMAINETTLADDRGEFDDWIEIYNPGPEAVDLAGYYLSDDAADALAHRLPAGSPALTTVPAGGFLVLWADGDAAAGPRHLPFRLSGGGEELLLTAPDAATPVDRHAFGPQTPDVSVGRDPDGTGAWVASATPTPGAANATAAGSVVAAAPTFSVRGGFHAAPVRVALATATPGASVHYTTDGSVPDEGDPAYAAPLELSANTPLRARALGPGLVASAPATETYLFDAPPTFAVAAYTADPVELFDEDTGMYPNFAEDIEIDVNVELYEPDGTRGFNRRFSSGIQGSASAIYAQKSLSLKARSRLGGASVDYRVFPDDPRERYRSLVLRNAGQDNGVAHFRDALATSLATDVSDVPEIAAPEILGQAYRPTVTYVNGAYWGIMNLRERTDRRGVESRFGLARGTYDVIGPGGNAEVGTVDAYAELERLLRAGPLDTEAAFGEVAARVDLDQYLDYLAFHVYIDNQDWPGNNVRRLRERREGARWRHLTYDVDYSFGLDVPGQDFNSGFNQSNSLSRILTDNGLEPPNPGFATLLSRRLLGYAPWRTAFVNRLADQLNLLYADARVLARIDAFEAAYRPEIDRHMARWDPFPWAANVEVLRRFATGRAAAVRGHVVGAFAEVTGLADVSVAVAGTGGSVAFSSVAVGAAGYTGTYFAGVDVPVAAVAAPGYAFVGWSGALAGDDPVASLRLTGDATLVATFAPAAASASAVFVNEVNYRSPDSLGAGDWVELYNPSAEPADLSGFILGDDDVDHAYVLPDGTTLAPGGFLVLAREPGRFAAVHPGVTAVVGGYDFGFSRGGDRVTLSDAAGALVDTVAYDDEAPWPSAPDGDGPTLELRPGVTDAAARAAPANWQASAPRGGTPGQPNSAGTPTGTVAAGAPRLRVWPSPARAAIAVAHDGLPGVLVLTDALGREVRRVPVRGGATETPVTLAGLADGVYVARLLDRRGRVRGVGRVTKAGS